MRKHIIFLFILFVFASPAESANDIATAYLINGTAIDLSATWVEYGNVSISVGNGNSTISVSVNTANNNTQARSYIRIKRDGTVIENYNLSQSVYPETVSLITTTADIEGTHYYSWESWCSAGRKCTLYNRTFSVIFIKSGSFAASVTNVTTSYPFTSTYGTTPNIAAPVAGGSTGGYLDSANWTIFNNTNATATTHTSQIGTLQSNDTNSNAKVSALQANDSYFNGTVFPQSTEFKNSTAVMANNTANSAVQTSLYNGNFPNSTNLPDAKNYTNSTNSSLKGYVDSGLAGKEPTIVTGSNNYFWNGTKQFVQLVSSYISDFNSAVLSLVNGTAQLQSVSQVTGLQGLEDSQNQSSANNNTASQNRDELINSTKANKTNIGEFTGGKVLDSLLFYSLNGTNSTAQSANATANNTNATLTTHVAATGTAVHGLGNMSTQNNNAVSVSGGAITGINSWDAINNTISVNISQVRNATTNNVSEGTANLYYTDARVLTIGNVTYLRLANISACTGGTNRTNFNGTAFTCEVDQTSSFSLNIAGGSAITGAAIISQGTGIIITQAGNNFTITSVAASVTNDTVNPYNLNVNNATSGQLDFNLRTKNVTVNVSTNVSGQIADANIASATTWNNKVGSVSGSGVIQSSGGQNPTISLVGAIPDASIPASAANKSTANTFVGVQQFSKGNFGLQINDNVTKSNTLGLSISDNLYTTNRPAEIRANGLYFTGVGITNPFFYIDYLPAATGTPSTICMNSFNLTVNPALTCQISNKSFKDNFTAVNQTDIDKLMLLNITKFNFKNQSGKHYGETAQHVKEIYPELARYNDGGALVTYEILEFIPLLIKQNQEQQRQIDFLEARVQKLEDRGILDIMFAKQINYLYNYFNITKP